MTTQEKAPADVQYQTRAQAQIAKRAAQLIALYTRLTNRFARVCMVITGTDVVTATMLALIVMGVLK